jgi:hypothetical protein
MTAFFEKKQPSNAITVMSIGARGIQSLVFATSFWRAD